MFVKGQTMAELSEKIQSLRAELGMSQTEFGSAIGVTPSAVQQWEQGRAKPYPKTLRKISEVTGKPLEWFTDAQSFHSPRAGATEVEVHTRPPNADASSIPRLAPMPPSKAKHIRQAKATLVAARDRLASALDGMEAQRFHIVLKV